VFSVNVIISPDDLKTQNASIIQYVGADQTEGGKAMGAQLLKDKGATATIDAGIVGDPDQIPPTSVTTASRPRSSPTPTRRSARPSTARSTPTSAFRSPPTCCRAIPT